MKRGIPCEISIASPSAFSLFESIRTSSEKKDDNDIDDIGIFDKIALINKDYNGLAYLLAYEISIDDIFSLNLYKSKQERNPREHIAFIAG